MALRTDSMMALALRALTMGGTWIAENLHRRDHGRFGFRRNRRGSCVIEVYAHAFGILRLKVQGVAITSSF